MKSLPLLFCSFLTGQTLHAIVLPAADFPDDGATNSYTSPDGLITFSTTNFFSGADNFLGDGGPGATANLVNAFNGSEVLTMDLEESATLTGLNFRWTEATVTISGFSEDPSATLSSVDGDSPTAVWDDPTSNLILTLPWSAGSERTLTLANAAASDGRTLSFAFAGRQATFTQFVYEDNSGPLPSPLVHYSFDDADLTATTLADLSGNGNVGTLVPSATAPTAGQPALFGESFRFAGGDDPDGVVTVASGVAPSGAAARTFSVWFNQENLSSQSKIFGYGGDTPGRAFDLSLEGSGIRLRHFGGFITYGSGFSFVGSDGGWQHLAVRVKNNAATFADVDVFLNGQALAPIAGGATGVTLNTASAPLALGSSATPGAAIGFEGFLDEFRLFDSALTVTHIRELAERPPLPDVISFAPSPRNRVPAGSNVVLNWDTENATTLTLDPGGIDVTGTTSLTVTPSEKTTYTLTASDEAGVTDSESVTISTGSEPFPNVVVFFLDDFGWADWEQNGAPTGSVFYETPNMNRMAREGLYFTDGYASTPVCSPTRGALMSGQAPAFNKLTDWITGSGDAGQVVREAEWVRRLPTELPNWPRTLAECGYRSIHIGKWHLGSGTERAADPLNHGFEVNFAGNQFGTPPGPERYFAQANDFSGLPNMGSDIAPPGSYLTDVLTEQTVAQIQTAAQEDTAFAIFLSHFAVHTPIQAPAATVAKYQAKLNAPENQGRDWQGHTNPTYAAMIEHVDLSLGAILDTLEDPDGEPTTDDSIAENTLVILTADNGGLLPVTSNRPLRNGKGGTYDGGIREPWIFWQPGKIAPGISAEPIVTHDLFPTILAQAGVAAPDGHEVSGQDLSPILAGQPFERERPFTFHYPHWSPSNQIGEPYSAIRKGDWKLIYTYANKSWELYNLADNPGENNNATATQADRHAVLSWMLAEELENLDANYPRNTSTLAEEPPVPLVTPAEDSDGDGQSDIDEAIQGTDGANPQSFFAPQPTVTEGELAFFFASAPGRAYALEASETLLPNSWQVIDSTQPLTDSSGLAAKRFYRVVTTLP